MNTLSSRARLTSCFAVLALTLFGALPASAQNCSDSQCFYSTCSTPAVAVDASLWGELEPTDTGVLPANRDTTNFDGVGSFENNPYWLSLDVEGGWVFAATSMRVQIWDARTDPGDPSLTYSRGINSIGLNWDTDPHAFSVFEDIDAPPGKHDRFAVAGVYGMGVAIFDASAKDSPSIKYQDVGGGRHADAVYAATIGGRDYAFVAAHQEGGVFVYDMTAAMALPSRCNESQPGGTVCPGVYKGRIGTRARAYYLDGAGNFIVVSSRSNPKGFEIWNVSNPASPQRRMEGLTNENVYGVAMWKTGNNHYLALRTTSQARIYNVSCITGGSCSLGAPIWSRSIPATSGTQRPVTFSRSNGVPFVYFGNGSGCIDGNQNEWLYNVSSPSNPIDISPQGTQVIGGNPVSYWGWYYRQNPGHGFYRVAPHMGKFYGDYFYRAAHSIFDIHKRAGASPPVANFTWNPAQVYPGTPVSFVDQSAGAPTGWDWTFPDGSPGSSTAQNPSGVTFGTTGTKNVQLEVTNGAGSNSTTRPLLVLPPEPSVASVSVSPNPALLCQPVTFSAQNVTGQPPLTFAWEVRETGGAVVDSGSGGNSFVWTSDPSATTGISYTGEVTVSNGAGSDTASAQVTLNGLPALPAAGAFAPTYAGAPTPPANATVSFSVNVPGATEWNWDFGAGYTGWTSDPIEGPNPTHTYSVVGTYDVRVQVRNCLETARESATIQVQINNIVPLEANFEVAAFCAGGTCFADVGEALTFNDHSTGDPTFYDYDWDGNGSFEDDDNTSPVTSHTYTSAGTYTPRLRIRKGGQSDTHIHQYPILVSGGAPPPTATISVAGPGSGEIGQNLTYTASAANCTPNPTGWTWTTSGATGSSTSSSITLSWASAGTKVVRATNSSCGTAQGSRAVTITDPGGGGGSGGSLNAVFTYSPSSPGVGQTITFDASATTSSTGSPSFEWDFDDGASAFGEVVTHSFTRAGSYSVNLTVSEEGSGPGCDGFGICEDSQTTTVTVTGGGGPPPPPPPAELNARFNVSGASCFSVSGQISCSAESGDVVTFSDTSTGSITSRSWSFGDGATASGQVVTHSWTAPGSYTVSLTVGDGDDEDTATASFEISGEPVAEGNGPVILPWVVQGQAALDQVSTLFVHNPDRTAQSITMRYLRRPVPDEEPPTTSFVLDAGATAYFPDVLADEFGVDNASGFVEVVSDDPELAAPVIVSFHRTFQPDGQSFGQAVPGVGLDQFPKSSETSREVLHLVGLNDDAQRLGFFGITNPNPAPARFQMRFFNRNGEAIGDEVPPMSVAAFGQRQFQVRTIRGFGITDQTDYRVEVEVLSGGPVYPYGANVRLASEDLAFIRPGDASEANVYLIGALATFGLNDSLWQTDGVLSNVGTSSVTTEITFINVGNTSDPLDPVSLTLLPGETKRLSNILFERWGIDASSSLGVLQLTSTSPDGVFPLVQAESYDNANPNRRFGQMMPALTEKDVATAGQMQVLAGLQQDGDRRTTIWVLNPGSGTAEYDLRYRALDGTEIGVIEGFRVREGRMRQLSPGQHPLVGGVAEDGFTVQVVVRSGSLLSAAQVVNNRTNDPAFVVGKTR